jgi:hypothetical protein
MDSKIIGEGLRQIKENGKITTKKSQVKSYDIRKSKAPMKLFHAPIRYAGIQFNLQVSFSFKTRPTNINGMQPPENLKAADASRDF